jgi:hypothetical protein
MTDKGPIMRDTRTPAEKAGYHACNLREIAKDMRTKGNKSNRARWLELAADHLEQSGSFTKLMAKMTMETANEAGYFRHILRKIAEDDYTDEELNNAHADRISVWQLVAREALEETGTLPEPQTHR